MLARLIPGPVCLPHACRNAAECRRRCGGGSSQSCLQFMSVNPPWALGSAWQSHPLSPASSLCCLQRDHSPLNPLQAPFLLTQLVMTLLLISLRTQRKNIILPFLYRICHLTIISTKDSALRLLSMDEPVVPPKDKSSLHILGLIFSLCWTIEVSTRIYNNITQS